MPQYVFSLNRVGKIVPPKKQILKDISLSFFPGAKIGVLGLNGAGKSTLLRIMAGVDKEIEGEAVPMKGLKIGYLPQEPRINPEFTVRQAVEEGMGEVMNAQKRLEQVYEEYADPNADFDKLAAEQAKLEAIIAAAGTNAEAVIDGRSYSSSSNKISAANVTYTLTSIGTTTMSVSQDTDKIVENVKQFVEDYNKMLDTLKDKDNEKQ